MRVCPWSLLPTTGKIWPILSFWNETWYYTNESLGINDDHVLKTFSVFSHKHYILCKMPLFISEGSKKVLSMKVTNLPNQK